MKEASTPVPSVEEDIREPREATENLLFDKLAAIFFAISREKFEF